MLLSFFSNGVTGMGLKQVWGCRVLVAMWAIMFCFLAVSSAQADFKKTKIAVLDFSLQGQGYETTDMGAIVAEWFITALVKEGRFDVVERALLQKIVAEQKLGITGVVDESSAAQLGRVLGVKIIISGSVLKLQNVLEVNARIIDVETGSIIAAENVKSSSSTSLQSLIVQMSQIIIKNFPLEGYIVKRSGKNVTIDLGRLAGVREGMEFITFKEGNIIKHPRTGEVLDVEQIKTGKIKISSVRGKISTAVISKEEKGSKIKYGQLVKSVAGELKPPAKQAYHVAESYTQPYVAPSRSSRRKAKNDPNVLLGKLKTENMRDKVYVAKVVSRHGSIPVVFDAIEQVLLKGYATKTRNKNHVDAMAWLCKALGASGKAKYKGTLTTVSRKAPSRKLRGYAKKALNSM